MAVGPDGGGDHVYVLAATSPAGGSEELWLAASHDGGATFAPAVLVPTGAGGFDVDDLALAADGLTVHVAWLDDRNGTNDVFYQQSTDGGATFLGADVQVSAVDVVSDAQPGLSLAVGGAVIAVAWPEDPDGGGNDELRVATSTDGGATFAPQGVGGAVAATDDVDGPRLAVEPVTGNVIVVWADDRGGADEVFAAVSSDDGATWGSDVQLSGAGGASPGVRAGGSGAYVAAWWRSGGAPSGVEAALSRDAGASFAAVVAVDDAAGDAGSAEVALNAFYDNFVFAWLADDGGTDELRGGGFRAATVTPVGFTSGGTGSFAFSNMNGDDGFAWVLLSNAPGTFPLPFGDGRDLGLNFLSPLFNLSLISVVSFFGPLDALGNGTTLSPFSFNKPVGFTMRATAISFALGPFTFGQLADVIPITSTGPVLVINEVDYDQPGSDTDEFVEIYNAGTEAADLAGVSLELVNGFDDAVYLSIGLDAAAATLAPGEYLVVGSATVVGTLPTGVPAITFALASNNVQNGSPDGLRLVEAGGTLDGLSYEGDILGVVEGTSPIDIDDNVAPGQGLSRLPNGADSDDNSADFATAPITPGAAN